MHKEDMNTNLQGGYVTVSQSVCLSLQNNLKW